MDSRLPKAQAYLDQLQNRLRAVPGVTFVSIARIPPLVNTDGDDHQHRR